MRNSGGVNMARIIVKQICCGTCKWNYKAKGSDDWVCTNDNSGNAADWTDFYHSCEQWEERK